MYHAQIAPVTYSDKTDNIVKRMIALLLRTIRPFPPYHFGILLDRKPIVNINRPDKVSDIVNSMLSYYETKKILPVWTLYANETNTMTGYHSIL
jgi:putative alpha-1,2-mannosidase